MPPTSTEEEPQKKGSPIGRSLIPTPDALAFTIISLIVCSVIYFTIYSKYLTLKREVQAKNNAVGLTNAIRAFYAEYGRYPSEKTTEDTELQSTAPLMRILLAEEPDDTKKLNRRDIVYFSADKAKKGRGGITPEDDFLDPWGSPYHIIIDTKSDSQITNPETGEPMPSEVEAYSPGPDQDPKTWKDNIKTW